LGFGEVDELADEGDCLNFPRFPANQRRDRRSGTGKSLRWRALAIGGRGSKMEMFKSLSDRLLFAIPKKGRLHQKCLDLLRGAQIEFTREHRLDIALVQNLPIALVFLPAGDIPRFVGEGNCDLGITGKDQVAESGMDVHELVDLDFGRCKLQVQAPANGPYRNVQQLIGKRIVTSFVKLTTDYFMELEGTSDMKTTIKYVGGSVEAACALGVADGVVDLVESGETMRAAGLVPINTVLETSAVLISSKRPAHAPLIKTITSRIQGVITAHKYVLCTYNCPRDKLLFVTKITPGRRAATITPLDGGMWVAVSSMVETKKLGSIMDELEAAGATDIIVFEMSNCRV